MHENDEKTLLSRPNWRTQKASFILDDFFHPVFIKNTPWWKEKSSKSGDFCVGTQNSHIVHRVNVTSV